MGALNGQGVRGGVAGVQGGGVCACGGCAGVTSVSFSL